MKPTEDNEETIRRRDQARSHCELLVESLCEAVVRVEEGNPLIIDRLVEARRSGSEQIVAIITTISAFCEVIRQSISVGMWTLNIYMTGARTLPNASPGYLIALFKTLF